MAAGGKCFISVAIGALAAMARGLVWRWRYDTVNLVDK
jgi:hypothetical protein